MNLSVRKARMGEIPNFTGISSAYEVPENPEIRLKTSAQSVEQSVDQLIAYLNDNGRLKA